MQGTKMEVVRDGASAAWFGRSASDGGASQPSRLRQERLLSALAVGGSPAYEVTIPESSVNLVFLASAVRDRRLPVPEALRAAFVKGQVYLRTADGFFALRSMRALVGYLDEATQRYEYIGQSALVRFAAVRGHTLRSRDKHLLYNFIDPRSGARVVEHLVVSRREVARWKELLGVRRSKSASAHVAGRATVAV